MNYSHPEYLTSAEDVIDGIERRDKRLRIFDTTVYLLPDPPRYRVESGRDNYLKGHIPTAGLLDLTRGMSDAASPLAFTLPERAAAAGRIPQVRGRRRQSRGAVQHHPHHVGDALVVDAALGRPQERDAARRRLHRLDRRRPSDRQQPHAVSDERYDRSAAARFVGNPRGSARRGRRRRRVHDQRAVAGCLCRHVEHQLRTAGTHPGQQEPLLRFHPRRSIVPQRRRNRGGGRRCRAFEPPTASSRIAAAAYRQPSMRSH